MWNDQIKQEQQGVINASGRGGWLSVILISMPMFLFDFLAWLAYQVPIAHGVPDTVDARAFWYLLSIGMFQLFYGVITMGIGYVALPVSVVAFFVLVYL